jgi:hypothetical protein
MKFYSLLICCFSFYLLSACSQDTADYPPAEGRPESGDTQVQILTPGGEINFSSDQPCVTLPGQQFFQFTEKNTLAKDGKAVSFILVLSSNGSLSVNFTHDSSNWLVTSNNGDHHVEIEGKAFSFKGEAAVLVDMKKERSEDIGILIICP